LNQDFEIGKIVEINGDVASVELLENDHCHSCGAKMICRPGDTGRRILKLRNTLNASVGNRILIEQSDKNQLKLAFMQYGFPLLGFLITIIIASSLIKKSVVGIPAELLQFGIACIALLLAGLLSRIWANRKSSTDFSVFSMKEICQ